MPKLDPEIIGILAVVANILTQAIKGLLSEKSRKFIPVSVVVVMVTAGTLLALYASRDLVAGGLEGLFAGASAVGLYELAANVPGLNAIFNSQGWLKR